MANTNRVILTGRLAKDPDVRATQNGTSVARFPLAVDDSWGEQRRVYFHNIVVWGKTAEAIGNYLLKGSKVCVSGKLTSGSYDGKDGRKVYFTEVEADRMNGVEFLDSKKDSQKSGGGYEYMAGDNAIRDEDIPF